MFMMRHREDFPGRKVEDLSARRKRQAAEATEAMRDYLRAQYAARDQLALLRQERLARESQEKN
jgi:hypothetical protein